MAAALLNGRTGLLLGIIGGLLLIAFYFVRFKKVNVFSLIVIITVLFGVVRFVSLNNHVNNFIVSLFRELYLFFFMNDATGTVEYLTESHFFLPDGIDFVFGKGFRIYGSDAAKHGMAATDIGYSNDMFMGGIVYCILLYGAYIRMLISPNLSSDKHEDRVIKVYFVICWILANLKGQSTVNYSIIVFLLFWFSLNLLLKDENNVRKEESYEAYRIDDNI